MDIRADHTGAVTGRPLLTAAQIAAMYGVQPKTVHAWEARGRLHAVGLDEAGRRLFDAWEAARAEASKISRARRGLRLRSVIPLIIPGLRRGSPRRGPSGGCGR